MDKLGIAYNIFDGEELLPYSLKNLRPFADYIVVVYQTTSNFGNENPKLKETLFKLKDEKLIDELIFYTPDFFYNNDGSLDLTNGRNNELKKRNLGLEACKVKKCNIFMCLDCDELYDHTQFGWALKEFIQKGYDTSFTQLLTYYKLPTMELNPPENYYAPLFYKIKKDTKFEFISDDVCPVHIDYTRRIKFKYSKIYTRQEIQMYHYSYVRNSLDSKIQNSSAQSDDKTKFAVKFSFDTWQSKEEGALLLGMQKFGLKEVDNKFNIFL